MSGSILAIYTMNGVPQIEEWITATQWGVKNDYFGQQWDQQSKQGIWC